MIAEGKTVTEIVAIGNNWPRRLQFLMPKHILELGTGQGASGAQIMSALGPESTFTTINYVDGHTFGEQLSGYYSDPRLLRLDADTIDPKTLELVPSYQIPIDLLFIDSTHEAWHAAKELRIWQAKLEDGAIVVVDDLNQNDMLLFWNSLPYEKSEYNNASCQGVFRYRSAVRYTERFNRPEKTTYGPRVV